MTIWLALVALGPVAPPRVHIEPGAVNQVVVSLGRHRMAIYSAGKSKVERILYTHARRDAYREAPGAEAVVPAAEAHYFRDPMKFWNAFRRERFHDYEARSSKWPIRPLPASRIQEVQPDSSLDWRGLPVQVIATPGITPGAVSYITVLDGVKFAFTGDLIYGADQGQLLEIHSLQAGIAETKTRGYHGYAARAADLLQSLRRLAALNPAVIVPARGPIVSPDSLAKLERRLTALLAEHFSTDALRWYWGDDNLLTRAGKILGNRPLDWMEMAEQRPLPDWVVAIQNSRLILSRTGAGFLIDCGNARILGEAQTRTPKVEGIFITHYHDDHTDHAQAAADALQTRVYASPELADILRRPHAYRMPAMTANPITSLEAMPEGKRVRWHEFEFTYLYYPGQTIFHGGLLVKKDGEPETLFFVGDSFTPSGIDDYCLQNRNLLDEDQGYLYCLRKLREMPQQPWLINQHVAPMFRFTRDQISRMESSLRKRKEILKGLTPFDHPNYAVDEQWAWFEPYQVTAAPGTTVELKLRLTNHSPGARTFQVDGRHITIPARASQTVPVKAKVPRNAGPVWMTAVTVQNGPLILHDWAEAMVLPPAR